jgi:hypothetical protein
MWMDRIVLVACAAGVPLTAIAIGTAAFLWFLSGFSGGGSQ